MKQNLKTSWESSFLGRGGSTGGCLGLLPVFSTCSFLSKQATVGEAQRLRPAKPLALEDEAALLLLTLSVPWPLPTAPPPRSLLGTQGLLSEARPLGEVPHDWTPPNQLVYLVARKESWRYQASKAGCHPSASVVTNGGLKGRSENIMQIKYRDRRKDHNLNLQNVIALSK